MVVPRVLVCTQPAHGGVFPDHRAQLSQWAWLPWRWEDLRVWAQETTLSLPQRRPVSLLSPGGRTEKRPETRPRPDLCMEPGQHTSKPSPRAAPSAWHHLPFSSVEISSVPRRMELVFPVPCAKTCSHLPHLCFLALGLSAQTLKLICFAPLSFT